MIANLELAPALKKLSAEHANQWLKWFSKLKLVAKAVTWGEGQTDESLEDATVADFVAAGYSAEEAAAFLFIMTQDHYGQPCDTVDQIDRWFTANVKQIGRL